MICKKKFVWELANFLMERYLNCLVEKQKQQHTDILTDLNI